MVPLFDLKEGQFGEIAEISDKSEHLGRRRHQDNCHHGHTRINDLGLRVGKIVTLLQKQSRGPLLVKVDESRIAIGRGMAECIKIKSIE